MKLHNIADCAASVGWQAFTSSMVALCVCAIAALLVLAYSRAGVINKDPFRPLQYAAGVGIVAAAFIGFAAQAAYYAGGCGV